jgi:3-dehydrosphinganine reductase
MWSIHPSDTKSILSSLLSDPKNVLLGSFVTAIAMIPFFSYLRTPQFDYDGKHVVITGGSSGIGLECAKVYARKGANISLVARDMLKLKTAQREVEACLRPGRKVVIVSVDTSTSQDLVTAALVPCLKELGTADVIVNSAGTSICGGFEELDAEEFERMLAVNVLGSVYATRAVVPGMKEKSSGRIVFVASQVAQVAIHGYSAYAASKWALRGLAEALQMELRPCNIYVSVCYPPDTDTPGSTRRWPRSRRSRRSCPSPGPCSTPQRWPRTS